jgi:hypothetical protein
MDIRGGTLNYEGILVLNNVEAAAYKGNLRRVRDRLIPTPTCARAKGRKFVPIHHDSDRFRGRA